MNEFADVDRRGMQNHDRRCHTRIAHQQGSNSNLPGGVISPKISSCTGDLAHLTDFH